MFGPARIFLPIAACALTTWATAQAPTSTTTLFDGIYAGSTTLTAGRDVNVCGTMTSVHMTVNHEQVVIFEIFYHGRTNTYYGSINKLGEVSASRPPGANVATISGVVRDGAFTGQGVRHICYFSIDMQKALVPATKGFDGKYAGVSQTTNPIGEATGGCAPNRPPAPLTIANGIARTLWGRPTEAEGYVNPQGILVMLAPNGFVFDGQIDGRGTISGRFVGGGFCSYQMV
jgi:hypothetical protein